MLKIPKKASLIISIILSVIFLAGCIVGFFVMPYLIKNFLITRSLIADRALMSDFETFFVHALGYFILILAVEADIMLLFLLVRVKNNLIFSAISVSLIRWVSWCCIIIGILFGFMGLYFQLALAVCFAAIFLGICLRVVKNVLEEATLIKSENDLTV